MRNTALKRTGRDQRHAPVAKLPCFLPAVMHSSRWHALLLVPHNFHAATYSCWCCAIFPLPRILTAAVQSYRWCAPSPRLHPLPAAIRHVPSHVRISYLDCRMIRTLTVLMKHAFSSPLPDGRPVQVAILVDCDNVSPDLLGLACMVAGQLGQVRLRRGYGHPATLSNRWQQALIQHAFTPCLHYQPVSGKNTCDIALALDALEALLDERANVFVLVSSDSDFSGLCCKLRERGARIHVVGEAKTTQALRAAADCFHEWKPAPTVIRSRASSAKMVSVTKDGKEQFGAESMNRCTDGGLQHDGDPAVETTRFRMSLPGVSPSSVSTAANALADSSSSSSRPKKCRPLVVVDTLKAMLAALGVDRVQLPQLGQRLRQNDPAFSPRTYGHTSLLKMVRTYDLLQTSQDERGRWFVMLARPIE